MGYISEKILTRVKSFISNKYIKEDYDLLLKRYYEAVRSTECLNKNCFDVINDYSRDSKTILSDKKVVFYSDSPYVATVDYDEKGTNVEGFGNEALVNLVDKLYNSGQKFIFSCRVVNGFTDEKKEGNYYIAYYVLLSFLEKFYDSKGSALWDNENNCVIDARDTSIECKPNKFGEKQNLYVMFPCKKI